MSKKITAYILATDRLITPKTHPKALAYKNGKKLENIFKAKKEKNGYYTCWQYSDKFYNVVLKEGESDIKFVDNDYVLHYGDYQSSGLLERRIFGCEVRIKP